MNAPTTPAELSDRLLQVSGVIATFATVVREGVIDEGMLTSAISTLEAAHNLLTALHAAKPKHGSKLQ